LKYHDEEWGVPVHNDAKHFEFLVLEGAQAGLSWLTVLRRRESYREAYAQFDPQIVSGYGDKKIGELLTNKGIVRNRLKITASVNNARCFLRIQEEFGSFDRYLWRFVDNKPVTNSWKSVSEIPAKTDLSVRISKDLVARGFKFVGPTIVYAHIQAVGLVNDHIVTCFRYEQLRNMVPPL
jgi:DNA-3-methyladenine glycosylase I